jgi:transcription initiation factor IIE alpha subunit
MPHGEKISPEVQWIILRLSKLLKNEQIAMCVGVSERSIRRIISHFREHGTIEVAGSVQEERTNNKHLRDIDVEVCISFMMNLVS